MAKHIHIYLPARQAGKTYDRSVRDCRDGRCKDCKCGGRDAPAQQAYRGYLIKFNSVHEEYYISKDGTHIGTASSLQAAKQIIDQIATGDSRARDSTLPGGWSSQFEGPRSSVYTNSKFPGHHVEITNKGAWIHTGAKGYTENPLRQGQGLVALESYLRQL